MSVIDFLSHDPLRVVDGVLDFLGASEPEKPNFYDNPLHIKFRSGLKLVHAAHYAKGSPSGGIEQSMKSLVVSMMTDRRVPVFDLGCGSGEGFPLFSDDTNNIVGVDSEIDLRIEAKRKYPAACIIRAALHDLPFKPQTMGTVIVCGVMEHLFELENSIACIARCMRTNGTLYVLAPTEGGLGFSAARFVTSFRNAKLLGMTPADARHAARVEHCNTVYSIEGALRKHFRVEQIRAWPFGGGPAAINLARAYRLSPL